MVFSRYRNMNNKRKQDVFRGRPESLLSLSPIPSTAENQVPNDARFRRSASCGFMKGMETIPHRYHCLVCRGGSVNRTELVSLLEPVGLVSSRAREIACEVKPLQLYVVRGIKGLLRAKQLRRGLWRCSLSGGLAIGERSTAFPSLVGDISHYEWKERQS